MTVRSTTTLTRRELFINSHTSFVTGYFQEEQRKTKCIRSFIAEDFVFTNSVLIEKTCGCLPRRALHFGKFPNETSWIPSLHGMRDPWNLLESWNHEVSELENSSENTFSAFVDTETEMQTKGTQPVRWGLREWQGYLRLQLAGAFLPEARPEQ